MCFGRGQGGRRAERLWYACAESGGGVRIPQFYRLYGLPVGVEFAVVRLGEKKSQLPPKIP